jgi:hypothetical protein
MDMQRIFDDVVAHMKLQRAQSRGTEICLYYNKYTGHQCAIGALLSPEQGLKLNSKGGICDVFETIIPTLEEKYGALNWDKSHDVYNLLSALQQAHDQAEPKNFLNSFLCEARTIAIRHGLKQPV